MTLGRKGLLRRKVLEALFDGPRSLTELVKETGASRQGVVNALKALRSEGLVEKEEGKRGKYYLTPNGYHEYHDRRMDKLVYDVYCDPKLIFDPAFHLPPYPIFDYLDLPSPCAFRVRLNVSEDLERKFAGERAFFSHEDLRTYTPEDTAEGFVRPFVNMVVWEILTERLFDIANYEKITGEKLSIERIKKFLRFSFKISISLDFEPSDRVMRIVSASLALKNLSGYEARSHASCFDVMELLERLGWAPKGWAKLLRDASDIEEKKEERGGVLSVLREPKPRNEKAVYDLLKEAFEILRKEGKVDSETMREFEEFLRDERDEGGVITITDA